LGFKTVLCIDSRLFSFKGSGFLFDVTEFNFNSLTLCL
jgi:hypothetical protein